MILVPKEAYLDIQISLSIQNDILKEMGSNDGNQIAKRTQSTRSELNSTSDRMNDRPWSMNFHFKIYKKNVDSQLQMDHPISLKLKNPWEGNDIVPKEISSVDFQIQRHCQQ